MQAASAEVAALRRRLAAESDASRKQIAELEGKARAVAAEREGLLEKVLRHGSAVLWLCIKLACQQLNS